MMRIHLHAWPVLVASLAFMACGGAKAPVAPPPSPESAPPESASPELTGAADGIAPFPYTADQIRAACPPGHTRVFRVEVAGKPAVRRIFRFLSATESEVEIETFSTDESGRALQPAKRTRSGWDELRQHAAFPRDRTTVTDDTVTTPAGTFAVKVYVVKGDGGEVSRYAFPKSLAGPPVLFSTDKGGARTMTSTLISIDSTPR